MLAKCESAPFLALSRSWVWVLAEGIPWAPPVHFLFPATFRAAARTLLLVSHHGLPAVRPATGGSGRKGRRQKRASLQQPEVLRLPAVLVQRVLRVAAASLSAWLPPLPSCRLEDEL